MERFFIITDFNLVYPCILLAAIILAILMISKRSYLSALFLLILSVIVVFIYNNPDVLKVLGAVANV